MKFDPFRSLSLLELEEAIHDLSMNLTTNAMQTASPDAGSVGYFGRNEGMKLLNSMERSRCARLGIPYDSGNSIRYRKVIVKRTGQ